MFLSCFHKSLLYFLRLMDSLTAWTETGVVTKLFSLCLFLNCDFLKLSDGIFSSNSFLFFSLSLFSMPLCSPFPVICGYTTSASPNMLPSASFCVFTVSHLFKTIGFLENILMREKGKMCPCKSVL